MSDVNNTSAVASAQTHGFVRTFHPGWFGVTMGTAVVGVAAYSNPGNYERLVHVAHGVGLTVVALSWLIAVAITLPYVARIVRYRDAVLSDLRHPVIGALYATMPAAILVIAIAISAVGSSALSSDSITALVAAHAAIGIPMAFGAGVVFIYMQFVRDDIAHETVNGGWFIPPVSSILIPLAIAPLIPHVDQSAGRLLLLIGYAALGIGLLLFLFVASTLFSRLIFHPLPPAQLAPPLWIGLGPIGVGSLALVRLVDAGKPFWGADASSVHIVSLLASTTVWGLGLWWLAIVMLLLSHYLRVGPLPFEVALWAFTFPLGAYTVSTLTLARSWNSTAIEWFAAALFVLLAAFWITVSTVTVRAIADGKALQK